MPEKNPYAPPIAEVTDFTSATDQAPPLWNPNAAASWSLVFSPIFGAYLHMKNWQALGQAEKAAKSKNWVIGLTVFFLFAITLPLFANGSGASELLGRFGGFVLLIAWYYGIGKSQSGYVLAKFGKNYKRRGWSVPLLIALGLFVGLIVAVVLLALAIGGGASAA